MNPFEFHLLNDFQHDFPLVERPFAAIAEQLGSREEVVLEHFSGLLQRGAISRIGAVLRPHSIGASTLAALAVPEERLEAVAQMVNAFAEVNHNYQREHAFNLWFVVTAPDELALQRVLREIEQASACPVLYLPLLEDYFIDLGFDLSGARGKRDAAAPPPVCTPDEADTALLGALQTGLPLVSRPYAALAEKLACTPGEVIARLNKLQAGGVIKRLGVVVRHHELGYRANAMVVWDVPDEEVSALGHCLGKLDFVTLCYRRPRRLPAWRYNLFCMIHGRDRDEVLARVDEMAQRCGGRLPHEVLFSVRRFKQCGAKYIRAA